MGPVAEAWKQAWEAEREAHRLLRLMVGMGTLDMLGGLPHQSALHDTEYSRACGHATLMESLAVSKDVDP